MRLSGVTLDSLLVVIQVVNEAVHFAGRNCGLRDFRKWWGTMPCDSLHQADSGRVHLIHSAFSLTGMKL